VPGIGRKGAQRIILELKDRIGPPGLSADRLLPATESPAAWREQVRDALVGLGWSAREADGAIDAVAATVSDDGEPVDVAIVLRAALRTLSKA